MIKPTINRDLIDTYEKASSHLIQSIRHAIENFFRNPPPDWEYWEKWRTPIPWKEKAIANLERYHADLQDAIRAFDRGDIEPIVYSAGSYSGLSHDMDFYSGWMSHEDEINVNQAIDTVVLVADQIYRIGYDIISNVHQGS